MKVIAILLAVAAIIGLTNGSVHYIKLRQDPDNNHACIIITDEERRIFRGFTTDDENELHVSIRPAVQGPADAKMLIKDNAKIIEIFAKLESIAQEHVDVLCKTKERVQPLEVTAGVRAPEIMKIVDGGDQTNRIDVVFMGDGYQQSEREKFFQDMARLTEEMFQGVTFKSYLPLFNIWAVFEASVDSGIGYNGAKNTPFRLYREAGQLRGIYTGNAAHARSVCKLTGASGCDYPSLIGNDDFYGGLGGEFVISTKSNRTGTVVLRHEMGHNFVDVGEEYDNGYVYSGVNAARSVATLGWRAWLSENPATEQRAIYRLKAYPWADLSRGTQTFTFNSDGTYSRWYMLVSVSAAGEDDCLEFTLDGKVLPWTSRGFDDREFFDWYGDQGFSSGRHTITVRSKTASTHPDIPRMICSVNIHEFGDESTFHMSNDFVSAYPTWDYYNRKTFRPTNAGCLMRNMTHPHFCPVCQEGMWYQFLQRITLIDDVDVASTSNPDGTKDVTVHTLKLGAQRPPGNEHEGEKLEIKWIKGGVEQVDLRDKLTIQATAGSWTVSVNFYTPDVRSDPTGLLSASQAFTVR